MTIHDRPGQIIILNGTPRSGKTSIAKEIQQTFDGIWMNLGVDAMMRQTPERYQPGIGLRPGGECPDLEPHIVRMYEAMFSMISVQSRLGFNVVVDVGFHESYSQLLGILPKSARQLQGLPVVMIGIKCPLEEIMKRRRDTWGQTDERVPEPVKRWQAEVHKPGIYDLEVDTSKLSPVECAKVIHEYILSGKRASAMDQLRLR
ncbi:chloramphenicol phosphotransferase CPT family protein [Jeotgalibacillus proteolyticus]|uniref:Chloramphenicol phosphotransferase n=1 Tax=Jeotgalibacillus proteolyticus TaxID=2082395 RepID=A0A2S5GDE7_9BACL|nr:chloramphenicol phosphotransferase [Jeotgalibacillus proteolyticus]PPA71016.1 chloramphenicol phosphotransferase [Jeotgalibacillus proteolyticus]